MSEPLKPCELECPKCGSGDVNRSFRAKGSETWASIDAPSTRYSTGGLRDQSFQDHIQHHCRCCHYEWVTKPLTKKKTK